MLNQIRELQGYIANQAQLPQGRETYKIHEQYDHSQPSLWPQFELKLRAKLGVDGHAMGDNTRRIYRLFAFLSGTAAQRALPWVENYATTSTTDDFFTQLRALFGDPTREKKALTRLNVLRQGKKPFSEFIPEFDQVLIEAGASQWDDRAKMAYLEVAINLELRERLIGHSQPSTYPEYCIQLREVSQQLEELQTIRNRTTRRQGRFTPSSNPQNHADTMDWEPTPAVRLSAAQPQGQPQSQPRRQPQDSRRTTYAPGVPQGVVQHRLTNGLCIRCTDPGHRARDCPNAVRREGPRVHRAKVPEANSEDPSPESLPESDDDDQGKD